MSDYTYYVVDVDSNEVVDSFDNKYDAQRFAMHVMETEADRVVRVESAISDLD